MKDLSNQDGGSKEPITIDLRPKKMPWYKQLGIASLVVAIAFSLLQWFDWEIDRRPVDATAYRLMADWTDNPHRRSGQDYSPLLPMIRKAMKDEVVYTGEWRPILEAKQDIEREHERQEMIRTLRSNRVSG